MDEKSKLNSSSDEKSGAHLAPELLRCAPLPLPP